MRNQPSRRLWLSALHALVATVALVTSGTATAQSQETTAQPPDPTSAQHHSVAPPPGETPSAPAPPTDTAAVTPAPNQEQPAANGPSLATSKQRRSTLADERQKAERAFLLLQEGLDLSQARDWEHARERLQQAWDEAQFPNAAYHLAVAFNELDQPQAARVRLRYFFALADATNPNYERARALDQQAADAASAQRSSPALLGADHGTAASPRVLPWVLMGSGGAMLLASITTGLLASAAEGELDRNCTDGLCDRKLESVKDRGETLQLATNILLIGGSAAVVAGAVSWWLTADCSGKGCSAAISGEF